MFRPVSCEIVRKTSLMSASFRSSEIGSPVNWLCASEIVRDWNVARSRSLIRGLPGFLLVEHGGGGFEKRLVLRGLALGGRILGRRQPAR